jgi:hypothetical protein
MGRAEAAWRKVLAEQSLADVQAEAHAPAVAAQVRQVLGHDWSFFARRDRAFLRR